MVEAFAVEAGIWIGWAWVFFWGPSLSGPAVLVSLLGGYVALMAWVHGG